MKKLQFNKHLYLIPLAIMLATQSFAQDQFKAPLVEPKVITPGNNGTPPSDAIILLDKNGAAAWQSGGGSDVKWTFDKKEGSLTVAPKGGTISTRQGFGDCQLHIEWRTPKEVKGDGQGRGNSGIFLMKSYEVQVLDSYGNKTYFDGQAGSIYKQHPPLVNPVRKPGEWQAYDIIFTAPKFNSDSTVSSPGRMTVLLNGVLIQNNSEIKGATSGKPGYRPHGPKEPIVLQDHGNPVSYRNIWIREL